MNLHTINHNDKVKSCFTGGLRSSSRHILRIIKANRMHLTTMWSATAKGLNTYVNERFQLLIFNTFTKNSKIIFSLCYYGLLNED